MRVLIGLMKSGKLERTAIITPPEIPAFVGMGWTVIGRDPTDEPPPPSPSSS